MNKNEIFLSFKIYPNLDISLLLKEISKFREVNVKFSRQEANGYKLVGVGFTETVKKNIYELAQLISFNSNSNSNFNSNSNKEQKMAEQEQNKVSKGDFMNELQQATLGLGSVIQSAIASSIAEGKKLQQDLERQNRQQREQHQSALKQQQDEHKKLLDEQRKQTETRFSEHLKAMQQIENNIRQSLDNAIKPLLKRIEASETRATSLENSLKNLTNQFQTLETALRNFAQELIKGSK